MTSSFIRTQSNPPFKASHFQNSNNADRLRAMDRKTNSESSEGSVRRRRRRAAGGLAGLLLLGGCADPAESLLVSSTTATTFPPLPMEGIAAIAEIALLEELLPDRGLMLVSPAEEDAAPTSAIIAEPQSDCAVLVEIAPMESVVSVSPVYVGTPDDLAAQEVEDLWGPNATVRHFNEYEVMARAADLPPSNTDAGEEQLLDYAEQFWLDECALEP